MATVLACGCFDMLHSEHVALLYEASKHGSLSVGVFTDRLVQHTKGWLPIYSEKERLYMVKAVKHVDEVFLLDSVVHAIKTAKPDIVIAIPDQELSELCDHHKVKFIAINTLGQFPTRGIPYRIDIAGTWIDQPYVSRYGAGWAITASILPTRDFFERGGMSTSTRNVAKEIWPAGLPWLGDEKLARILFCTENAPETKEHISGAQDAIGICMPGLTRHFYDGKYWPSKIESCYDEDVLIWLEDHICLVEMFPRRPGCSVVDGKNVSPEKVGRLTAAASRCWDAIMRKELKEFASAFKESFDAQVAMFPAMMQPGVQEHIDMWKGKSLAWKMLGAGGGGHLALVVDEIPDEVIRIKIRRKDTF